MKSTTAIRLVAMREIRERFRSRVFRVSSVIGAGIVCALIVIPTLNEGKTKVYDVALVGTSDPVIAAAVKNVGPSVGAEVRVHVVASAEVATRQLKTGVLDLALIDGRRVVINDAINPDRVSTRLKLVAAVSEAVRLQTSLTDAGLSPAQAAAALSRPPLPVNALSHPKQNSDDQFTNFVGVIAIFIFFQQYGSWILVGVAEEKSSRIAEVLLAAVKPRQLVSGKILGIGVVGLTQALFVAISAIVASRIVGSNVLAGANALAAVEAVGWFVLGFGLYGWAFAAAGSLVSRQSEAQAAGFPIMIPIFAGYFATISSLGQSDPTGFLKVLAYLPPTAPLCMPTLISAGAVQPWQVAASIAGVVLSALVMARVASAIYSSAILRTGKRIKWLEAIRAA
ncbi:MAG: type transport system permease protein [Actinomycetota bacterium]